MKHLHPNSARPKVRCPMCRKKVKSSGLWQHYISVHEMPGVAAKMLSEVDLQLQGMDRRAA